MSHEALLIGIDAGGTSTRALLTDERGRCLGYGVGGRGNPISAGPDLAASGVLDAVTAALAPSGHHLSDVSMIVPAMAGMRASGRGEWLSQRLRPLGFSGRLIFEADLLATYFSGAADPFGYALVSGTGACVIRVREGRIDRASDGFGWLLGDRGSGFWIGRSIAQAAVQDLDATAPRTALTDRVLTHHGLQRTGAGSSGRSRELEQLISALYARPPIELAALAPYAFEEAEAGDAVAEGILRTAGELLADTLAASLDGPGPLVVGGSILARPGAVREGFLARLGSSADDLELRHVADGVVGAAVLAMRAASVSSSDELLERLTAGVAAFRPHTAEP